MRLSERECQELRALAQSASLREACEQLRVFSRELARKRSSDDVVEWLTAMNRMMGHRAKPRQPFIATNMKL